MRLYYILLGVISLFNSFQPESLLTHWDRVTHICVSELTIIRSDNGMLPGGRQAIIWNNAGLLLIEPLGTNFSEISIGIQTFSFKKMHLNMTSAKWRPFCLGLNVLNVYKSWYIFRRYVCILMQFAFDLHISTNPVMRIQKHINQYGSLLHLLSLRLILLFFYLFLFIICFHLCWDIPCLLIINWTELYWESEVSMRWNNIAYDNVFKPSPSSCITQNLCKNDIHYNICLCSCCIWLAYWNI